jgi:hypothetical protein
VLVLALMEMYVEGVSTRKVKEVNRGAVRHVFLQEHGLLAGWFTRLRARSLEGPSVGGEGLSLPVCGCPL